MVNAGVEAGVSAHAYLNSPLAVHQSVEDEDGLVVGDFFNLVVGEVEVSSAELPGLAIQRSVEEDARVGHTVVTLVAP